MKQQLWGCWASCQTRNGPSGLPSNLGASSSQHTFPAGPNSALQAPHRQYKCAQRAPAPPFPASQANLAHAGESSPPAGSVPAITQVRAVAWNHGHLPFTRLGLRREEGWGGTGGGLEEWREVGMWGEAVRNREGTGRGWVPIYVSRL